MPCLYNDKARKEWRQNLRNASTQAEMHLWNSLQRRQFEGLKFRRQYGVGPFILDFYCANLRLGIEIDGDSHESQKAKVYDQQRTNFLNSQNIDVVRFHNAEVIENVDQVLQKLRTYIAAKRASLPP
jgi:very-short-patch-repair endonuclease